jgi:hypothetical protein
MNSRNLKTITRECKHRQPANLHPTDKNEAEPIASRAIARRRGEMAFLAARKDPSYGLMPAKCYDLLILLRLSKLQVFKLRSSY